MQPYQPSGVFTALITPFHQGAVDFTTLDNLIEDQIQAGVAGIVPVGTTGESPTLDTDEHIGVIRHVVKKVAGRVQVIAGTGANCTREAIHLTREADLAGADGFLQVAPYYNKPSQEGLFRHYSAIAEITAKPIVLYSIPGRCGIEIAVGTVKRLGQTFPHVRSIKEAGGTVSRVNDLRAACGEDLTILCGDDSLTLPFMAAGATGVISVASNLIPASVVELVNTLLAGDFNKALSLHSRWLPLFGDLFIEGNPVTVKEAMLACGKIPDAEVRLPLWPISESNKKILHSTLRASGLL